MISTSIKHGVWTALPTPFTKNFHIDWKAWEKIIETHLGTSVSGLVICGSTGEGPTVSTQEKLSLLRKAKVLAAGRVQVMASVGSNYTEQAQEFAQLAEDSGADNLLVVTPPYNKPSVEGLIEHFSTISQSVKCPICLYHIPSRTGQKLSWETMKLLMGIEGIQGVKEASGDLSILMKLIHNYPKKTILIGDDFLLLPGLSLGSHGIVSVASNLLPNIFIEIWNSYKNDRLSYALSLYQKIYPLIEALFCESNPAPLKALLHNQKFCENTLRLPLVGVSKDNEKNLITIFEIIQAILKKNTQL